VVTLPANFHRAAIVVATFVAAAAAAGLSTQPVFNGLTTNQHLVRLQGVLEKRDLVNLRDLKFGLDAQRLQGQLQRLNSALHFFAGAVTARTGGALFTHKALPKDG